MDSTDQSEWQSRPSGRFWGWMRGGRPWEGGPSIREWPRAFITSGRSFRRTKFEGLSKLQKRAILQEQDIELPAFLEKGEAFALFRCDEDSAPDSIQDIAQISYDNSAGRATIMVQKSGQQIQVLHDRPPRLPDGKLDPEARITGLVFKHDRVTVEAGKMALDLLEANGQLVDIDNLNINGTKRFCANMKAALQGAQTERSIKTAKTCEAWSTYLMKQWDFDVNTMKKYDADTPKAEALERNSYLAAAIGAKVQSGKVSNIQVGMLYRELRVGIQEAGILSKPPNFEHLAKLVGIDPEAQEFQPQPKARPKSKFTMGMDTGLNV